MPVTSAYSVQHSYYLMYKAAELSLAHAVRDTEQRALYVMNAYVMIAFTLEAYVNDFCAVSLPAGLWNDVEKKLSTREKLKLASACLQIPIDFSSQPFQEIKRIFQIRDQFAHSKRSVNAVLGEGLAESRLAMPKAKMEILLSDLGLAKKLYKAVFEMITFLHNIRSEKDGEGHPLERGAVSHFITIQMTKKSEPQKE